MLFRICAVLCNFYPRPPRGGRHRGTQTTGKDAQFLSTPSARRATHYDWRTDNVSWISIHALREEGDSAFSGLKCSPVYFYPRPPRGGRQPQCVFFATPKAFLSTPSARRATPCFAVHCPTIQYFYPRPPRGGRPYLLKVNTRSLGFLSTPSARRATPPQP